MIIEDLSINDYMRGWYREDYSKYSKEQIQLAHCEYMDMSGLYESKQFQQLSYINYLSVRVASMQTFIEIQREYTNLFGEPFVEGLDFAERYHHNITWENDKDLFLASLSRIEKREKKYITELKQQKFLFFEEEKKAKHERKSMQESRSDFLRNLNILGKTYRIDRNITMMDEYALMLKDTLQEQKEYDAAKLTKHRNRYS